MNYLTAALLLIVALPASAADDLPAKVTFAEHVAPIVFEQCATCHRPGQVAPFPLLNYADTRRHAKTMERVIRDRYMPPWQPVPGHGEFKNERRLTDRQIALFTKWVETGMEEGDPKRAPELPKFPEGWQLGKPDLVVKMDRPFEVPADGPDIYQNFVLPLHLSEDKWVTAVEFRASAPEIVHHVLYFLDDTGKARGLEPKTGQPGFPGMRFRPTERLGGWAVGAVPIKLPEGLAYPMKKGSDLVLQTHFHLSGKAVREELTVGIYFADKPPTRTLAALALPPVFGLFSQVKIPAGRADFKVADSFTLPVDVDLVGASAHAHYLGKTMDLTAKLPDGTVKPLFEIRDWDFNWQGQYLYRDFVRLPKGTVIRGEVTWDNSAKNPRNPSSPPVDVKWGEGSLDEMGQVALMMVPADEADRDTLRGAIRRQVGQALIKSRLRGDKIPWAELGIDPTRFGKDGAAPEKRSDKGRQAIRDTDGREQMPLKVEGAKANVLVFVSTDCPISNGYWPEIEAIAGEFGGRGVRFFAVHADPELTPEAARKHAKEFGITMPVLIDSDHSLAAAAGATRMPEVAVLLPDGSVAYRGRIDDRYPTLGAKRASPSRRDLRIALESVLAGEKVAVPRTEAVGCSMPDLPKRAK